MKKSIAEFLQFNGRNIYFQSENGITYIAIKPICESLNVDYSAQLKNIKEDETLNPTMVIQTIVAADGKMRKMSCLPEFFIYGWIFSIQSTSIELKKYKWECYKILYNHFHGTITGRAKLLQSNSKDEQEKAELYASLKEDERMKRIEALDEIIKARKKSLLAMDKDLASGQLSLFDNPFDSFFKF